MKQRPQSVGKTLVQLLLSLVLIFSILAAVAGGIGVFLTASPSLLLSQLERQQAPAKTRSALESYYQTEYNATAVPPEVYLDVLSENWLRDAMELKITAAYDQLHGKNTAAQPDYSALEQSITDYFETYAAENGYEKDDSYTQKLENTIQNAEKKVDSVIDVYHLGTLEKAGIWHKVQVLSKPLWLLFGGGVVLTLVLAAVLLVLRNHPLYWIGSGLFTDGVLLTLPAAAILGSGVISRFSLKDAAVYSVFTGTMKALVLGMLIFGGISLAAGLVLLIGSIARERSQVDGLPLKR
ncbi:hypothetical protein [uncultured Ruminococcus sp.]|uniref:hypothetical protein n=1 Tax=uncultured Ruminococcus sp. TaxID=165186 RepID=UPI0025CC9379|nr:hypothetical protein [uncultured Ruminococcus sp.]